MLSAFVGTSVVILGTVVGQLAKEPKGPLTPAEIVAQFKQAPLTRVVLVKYRVRDVADSNPDWTFLYADELPNQNLFAVKLSRAAQAAIKHDGVSDLAKHFVGMEVEVQGRIEVAKLWCFPARDLYTLRVENLEQIRERRATDPPTDK